MSVPYTETPRKYHPTIVKHIPERKVSALAPETSSFAPLRDRTAKRHLWSWKRFHALLRPKKAPVQQFPTDQEHFANRSESGDQCSRRSPVKISVLDATNSSLSVGRRDYGCEHHSPVPARPVPLNHPSSHNSHNSSARGLLTLGKTTAHNKPHDAYDLRAAHLSSTASGAAITPAVDGGRLGLGLPYSRENYSFSSLPTTASKAALKPSPLRVSAERTSGEALATPLRSSSRKAPILETHKAQANGMNFSPHEITNFYRPQSSSSITTSVYSSDADRFTHQQPETPSTLPPPIAARSQSRRRPRRNHANDQVDDFREELGIIDDCHTMYADAVKKERHKATMDGIQGQGAELSKLNRTVKKKPSRTQRLVAKERARKEASYMLARQHPDLRAQEADSDYSFNFISHQKACQTVLAASSLILHHQHHAPRVEPKVDVPSREEHLLKISEGAEQEIKGPFEKNLSNDSHAESTNDGSESILGATAESEQVKHEYQSQKADAESKISLLDLRDQFLALVEENEKQNRPEMDTPSPCLRRLTVTPTLSDSQPNESVFPVRDIEYAPLDLQKIEVVWKGRRYPVLIGEKGKIWEGPCTMEKCTEHGRRWQKLSYGLF